MRANTVYTVAFFFLDEHVWHRLEVKPCPRRARGSNLNELFHLRQSLPPFPCMSVTRTWALMPSNQGHHRARSKPEAWLNLLIEDVNGFRVKPDQLESISKHQPERTRADPGSCHARPVQPKRVWRWETKICLSILALDEETGRKTKGDISLDC